ncbi:MAG: uracil-DNA glycosylase [Elusimicrobia bacterium CG_4_10_14_0_2_um_filter_56_8]|nr:MAG: uracil-DNA glycosylase [Elusimicrobia bacterium CG1_02_56_21]PJA15112.1 MAG: uracil-DNA glycosylase [Elusimicrobia bacterium CG_4_10_14_0_2_um_filter_56_8]
MGLKQKAARAEIEKHVKSLLKCRRCPQMLPPVVSGGPVLSRVLLVGQAPGDKEPVMGRPFAWTAGKSLFAWFKQAAGIDEAQFRASVYIAAVCRCFPGKKASGGDRVPSPAEVIECSAWLNRELELLRPELVIPIGKLAIAQFMEVDKLDGVVGRVFRIKRGDLSFDLIPLPHSSGASPWRYTAEGKPLLAKALALIGAHPAMKQIRKNLAPKPV